MRLIVAIVSALGIWGLFAAQVIEVRTSDELYRVRDRLQREKPTQPTDIVLAPGEYALPYTFVLTAADSGTAAAPIRYRAKDGQARAILTAAKRVPTERFRAYRDGIVVADISDLGVTLPTIHQIRSVTAMPVPVPEVFVDGVRMCTADWPNGGEWATFTNIVVCGYDWKTADKKDVDLSKLSKGVFGYEGDRPSRWTEAPYVWVHGYFRWDWRDNALWMEKIDPVAKTIALGYPATYGLALGNPSPRRWRAVHLLEELDVPGEYYVDFFEKKLYLMPTRPLTAATRVDIVAGADPLMSCTNLKHVAFENLVLRNANAALKGRNCSNVSLVNVRVENMRGNGLFLEDSDHVLVRGCDFAAMGANCLTLSGGDRKTLTPSGNRVTDCTFGPAGVLNRTSAAAFATWGVGTVFEHNFVHDMPNHAISIGWQGGNDCIFAYNVISNVCNESDDLAAFYKGRNPSACGNVLDHNVFVDCGKNGQHGTMAVYFDDGDCGDTVRDCLFVRCGNVKPQNRLFTLGALFFNGGYAFTTERNVFVDCPSGSRTSAALEEGGKGWATDQWWKDHLKKLERRLLEEVCVTGAVYLARYPWMKDLLPGLPDGARTNYLNQCTFINVPVPTTGRSFALTNCRILDHDDGTRPEDIEKAGVLTPRKE